LEVASYQKLCGQRNKEIREFKHFLYEYGDTKIYEKATTIKLEERKL
jgi:hypothetical protein